MKTGFFEQSDGKLYYEVSDEGEGKETLVLSHAAFLDSRMWDTQWNTFAEHFQVIRYDMRGYGQSDLATTPRCRRDDLAALLAHLKVASAHLLGCSMGGEIVLDLALEQPDLVKSLTIVNGMPNGFEPQGEPPQYILEMIAATQQGKIELASELQLRIWFDGPQRTPDQVDQVKRQQASVMNRIFITNGTWASADMQPLNPLTPPAIGRLHEVHVSTLIVAGALDHAENLRASALMASQIPGAQKVTIDNTAHVPNMEKPEEFNRAVLEFLGM